MFNMDKSMIFAEFIVAESLPQTWRLLYDTYTEFYFRRVHLLPWLLYQDTQVIYVMCYCFFIDIPDGLI